MASYDLKGKKVWVAGHRGMVGSAIVCGLASEGCEIMTADRSELDLKDQTAARAWVERQSPTQCSWRRPW